MAAIKANTAKMTTDTLTETMVAALFVVDPPVEVDPVESVAVPPQTPSPFWEAWRQ
jgi:hypothetical protein